MPQLTESRFCIDGNEVLHFNSFTLNQNIFSHHQFKLTCPVETIDGVTGIFTLSRELIGCTFSAHISCIELKGEMQFSGIITSVETSRLNGNYGEIIISGYSPTITLDSGPHCKSWEQKSITDIVQDVLKFFPQNLLNAKIQPLLKEPFEYLVQYKETAWVFLQRITGECGEWLFWDGRSLVIGLPKGRRITKLTCGSTLSHFNINLNAIPSQMQYVGWDYQNSQLYTSLAPGESVKQKAGLNTLGEKVYAKTQIVYGTQPKQWNHRYANNKKQQDDMATLRSAIENSKTVYLTGQSCHPALELGTKTEIVGDNAFSSGTEEYGEYLIVTINHYVDTEGNYSNNFTAIPSSVILPPVSVPNEQDCQTQSGIVTDNYDPQGLGRVRVKFHWMNGAEKTPWIRVVSPHGGGGKGHFFIPEINEEVMVGFEGHSATKPYVIGSVYHSNANTDFSNAGNDIKMIQTRSGTKVRMNDAEGSVFIEDQSGNTWFMDGQGNISIKAPNDICITAGKDILMNAGRNMEVNVVKDLSQTIGNQALLHVMNQLFIQVPFMKQVVTGYLHTQTGKALFNSLAEIKFESPEMYIAGEKKLFLHSDTLTTLNSKGKTEIKGAEGNAHTNIAEKYKKSKPENIALAIVHFRTNTGYNGEFGFDWLRVDDNNQTKEPAYEKIIEGGYSTKMNDLGERRDLTKTEAFDQLKTEYQHLGIERKDLSEGASPPAQPPVTEYFVPYLTLFSKEFVNTLTLPAGAVAPKYEATLRVLVDIEEPLDKLEFEFDNTLFSLDKTTLADKSVTGGLIQSIDSTINITCLKDLDRDQEIIIYAYPQGVMANSKADQLAVRRLAGKIKILKNDIETRRESKFVLVEVNTNITGMPAGNAPGKFKTQEKINLYYSLYQALIIPSIEEATLDLSSNDDFKANGTHIWNNKIAFWVINKENEKVQNERLYPDVKKLFLDDEDNDKRLKNKKYEHDYFTIFVFGVESNITGVLGAVQDIGVSNVIMFTLPKGGDDCTLNHETLHGLGLCHTHRDSIPLNMAAYKYIYPNAISSALQKIPNRANATDNIMSYQSDAHTSWYWQWKIVNSNIR